MTRSKYKQPLESFDPRLIQLLLRGALQPLIIPCPTRKYATILQRRLHTLRARMRDEDHTQARNVTRTIVRRFWGIEAVREGLVPDDKRVDFLRDPLGERGAYIVISKPDEMFEEMLASLDHLEPLAEVTQMPADTLSIEDLLGTLPDAKN